jgi:hypothetical protein
VANEHLRNRRGNAPVGNSDLGTNVEILHSSPDKRFGRGRAIDIDRFGAILIPRGRHQPTEPRSMIVVMMGEKHRGQIADINVSFRKPAGDAVAGIDKIVHLIDSQQIRRLRPVRSWDRPSRRPECNQAGTGL